MKVVGEFPIPPESLFRCRKCGSYLVPCPYAGASASQGPFRCPECDCPKCPFYPCRVLRPVGEFPIPPIGKTKVRVDEK